MVLFDWGTYNALTTLKKSELIGMKLTEIPPYDFSRKNRDLEYFKEYHAKVKKAFTTVTAHAPYYSLIPRDLYEIDKLKKIMLDIATKAELAGAEILNLHIGGKLDDKTREIEIVSDIIKYLLSNTKKIKFSLETTYTERLLGSIDDIRAIIENVGSDRVLISLQLENDWMREKKVYLTGKFHKADQEVDEHFWYKLLDSAKEMGSGYLSLRFSQITGVKLRGIVVKKRVPLGMGYPKLEYLARAIAKYIVKELYEKGEDIRAHIIYTGPSQTKYKDTIKLYSIIAQELSSFL